MRGRRVEWGRISRIFIGKKIKEWRFRQDNRHVGGKEAKT